MFNQTSTDSPSLGEEKEMELGETGGGDKPSLNKSFNKSVKGTQAMGEASEGQQPKIRKRVLGRSSNRLGVKKNYGPAGRENSKEVQYFAEALIRAGKGNGQSARGDVRSEWRKKSGLTSG